MEFSCLMALDFCDGEGEAFCREGEGQIRFEIAEDLQTVTVRTGGTADWGNPRDAVWRGQLGPETLNVQRANLCGRLTYSPAQPPSHGLSWADSALARVGILPGGLD